MQSRQIAIASIKADKPKPEDRTFSKEFCTSLAGSIKVDGLLHDPIVREVKPGEFKVIAGRNRLYACGKVLGWTEIPCKVVPPTMTDDEAKAIELAENLWRNNLSDAQLKKALVDWQRLHAKSHPLADGSTAASKQAAETTRRVEQAKAEGKTVEREEVAKQVASENKSFQVILHETLGISLATAGRLARIAKHLEKDQIEILDDHKVTNENYERLAALASREHIDKAINLIASGMDHAEAIRQAAKAKKDAGKKGPLTPQQKAVVPKSPKATPKPLDADLTDEEWLVARCDVMLKTLKRKGPFKRDAILYRRISDTLVRLRTSVKKPLQEAKNEDGNGAFYSHLLKLTRATHPSKWLVCGTCNGTGSAVGPGPDGKEAKATCPRCFGSAYILKTED